MKKERNVSETGKSETTEQALFAGETRVLITGANGFVGRHLIAHLLGERNVTLSALKIIAAVHLNDVARMRQEYEDPFCGGAGWVGGTVGGRVEIVGMELGDAAGLEALIGEYEPQQVYHLAARASGADADRDAIFAANVGGTRALLEAASRLKPFPRVLLASTGYVYGNTPPERPAQETDPIGPLWKYGAYADSKMEMENVAKAYRGLAITARAFAHTGPGQTAAFAVPTFARQIARMERGLDAPELRVGNLDALRDLMDARDVVRAYALLMDSNTPPGAAFNIATSNPVRMRYVVERLCTLSNVQPAVITDPARLRPLDIACSTGNASKLQAATGWQPQIPLEDTLRDLLDFWRNVED